MGPQDTVNELIRHIASGPRAPVQLAATNYKKLKRPKPETVIQDYQFMQMSDEPLQRVLGLDHIKKAPGVKVESKPKFELEPTRKVLHLLN